MIAMALQVLIAASVCPSSHSTLTQLDATSLMKAALASDCTLTQQRWSAHPRAQFNGEDLFQIRNLVRIQDGIPSTSALSLDLSPKGSRHGHHHLVLRGYTEEHGNLVARIGHVSGSLDSLQEAGFGSAFGLEASRPLNWSSVCVENPWRPMHNEREYHVNTQLVASAAAINPKAAARNAPCSAMVGELGLSRFSDVEGTPRAAGLGCCAIEVAPTCTVPLFIQVSEEMHGPHSGSTDSLAPRCQKLGWGALQCHLARINDSLVLFEQLTETSTRA